MLQLSLPVAPPPAEVTIPSLRPNQSSETVTQQAVQELLQRSSEGLLSTKKRPLEELLNQSLDIIAA
jgi:hypothetical protein